MNPWGWHVRDGIMRHFAMSSLLLNLFGTLRSALRTRAELAFENLALRQQLASLRRTTPRVRLRPTTSATSRLFHLQAEKCGMS
jgi:hypothetical protein